MENGEAELIGTDQIEIAVTMSAEIGELVGALAKAQLEYQTVTKDQKNPYYNSKYADLANIIACTQPALAKAGLVIIQPPGVSVGDQKVKVVSILAHSSGQWIRNELTLPAVMRGKDGVPRFDAQSCGAAMTYGRRYSYQGLAGVAAELDDDGNAASGVEEEVERQKRGETPRPMVRKGKPLTTKQSVETPQNASNSVPALFWTAPDQFNGHRAVFLNLKEFGSTLGETEQQGLKIILKKYLKGKGEDLWVPTSGPANMTDLVDELLACNVNVRQLAGN